MSLFNINEENIKTIQQDYIVENVMERKDLIAYLNYILNNDGEIEKFLIKEGLEDIEPIPDFKGFRDWLIEGITPNEEEFNTLIRKNYIQTYIKDLYWVSGEWSPDECVPHKHINWDAVCEELIETQYEEWNLDDQHPYNIFRNSFYLRLE